VYKGWINKIGIGQNQKYPRQQVTPQVEPQGQPVRNRTQPVRQQSAQAVLHELQRRVRQSPEHQEGSSSQVAQQRHVEIEEDVQPLGQDGGDEQNGSEMSGSGTGDGESQHGNQISGR
jgi:hypothetical protein